MGTRNLTAAYIDGEYKIAQYGQWDGYPSGQGIHALRFARELTNPDTRKRFEEKLRAARWITKREVDIINEKIDSGKLKNWQKVYPELSRDTCADILDLVLQADDGIKLENELAFAADSLFCEWAWVIDLDKNTFEGYKGFNKQELTPEDRFYFLRDQEDEEYHGVVMVASWPLDNLPDDDAFIAAFKKEEE